MRAHEDKTTLVTAVIGPAVSQDISVAENTKPGSADALPGILYLRFCYNTSLKPCCSVGL